MFAKVVTGAVLLTLAGALTVEAAADDSVTDLGKVLKVDQGQVDTVLSVPHRATVTTEKGVVEIKARAEIPLGATAALIGAKGLKGVRRFCLRASSGTLPDASDRTCAEVTEFSALTPRE